MIVCPDILSEPVYAIIMGISSECSGNNSFSPNTKHSPTTTINTWRREVFNIRGI
jgi:hypothetical protein